MTDHVQHADTDLGVMAIAVHKEAIDALKITNAVTALATRYDTKLVIRVLREWLDYMDRQMPLTSRQAIGDPNA